MAMAYSEIIVPLRLSEIARTKLAERASASGQDAAEYVSNLVEQFVTRPDVDEVLAPFRRQVAESGMSDQELDDFHRDLLNKVRTKS